MDYIATGKQRERERGVLMVTKGSMELATATREADEAVEELLKPTLKL